MATELKLELHRKWRVSGESATALGADGVGMLAASAYGAMLRARWKEDVDAASMPVHEYDRARPNGQAYKAVWGYDAAARAERSCCGAECHTFALPADALTGTPAAVVSISAPVVVDRYCDEGVKVLAVRSSDPEPPLLAEALELDGWSNALYATKTQVDASGNQLAPNRRHGDGGATSFPLVSGGSGGYLHLILVMADYLGVRGAWIEGGAMFADETADVAFGRDVAPDTAPSGEYAGTSFDLGVMYYTLSTPELLYWTLRAPARRSFVSYLAAPHGGSSETATALRNGESTPTTATRRRAQETLAASFTSHCPLALSGDFGLVTPSLSSGSFGFDVASARAWAFSAAFSGFAAGGTFRGMRFSNDIDTQCRVDGSTTPNSARIPFRLVAYGVARARAFGLNFESLDTSAGTTQTEQGYAATPLPAAESVFSEAFLAGEADSVGTYTALRERHASNVHAWTNHWDMGAEGIPAQALAVVDCPEGVLSRATDIPFLRPFETGDVAQIVICVVPTGAEVGEGETYDGARYVDPGWPILRTA